VDSIGYIAPVSSSRPYQSSLRDERARETRLRIRTSARELFASTGFTATTITQIAERAGVSQQTVYKAFGTKGAIVGEMLDELEESQERLAILERLVAEEDPQTQLRLFVSMHRTMFEGGIDIIRAALAARNEPDVAAMAERGDAARRAGTGRLAEGWARRGALRNGLSVDDAAEVLWLLSSAHQFVAAMDDLGWDPDRYEQWLADLLTRELLAP
jgi:AcrR family transcriptional regulator